MEDEEGTICDELGKGGNGVYGVCLFKRAMDHAKR